MSSGYDTISLGPTRVQSDFQELARCFFYTIAWLKSSKLLEAGEDNSSSFSYTIPVLQDQTIYLQKELETFVKSFKSNTLQHGSIVVQRQEKKNGFSSFFFGPTTRTWKVRFKVGDNNTPPIASQLSNMVKQLVSETSLGEQTDDNKEEDTFTISLET